MKALLLTIALATASLTTSAFAQTTVTPAASVAATSNAPMMVAQSSPWSGSPGMAMPEKTHAQVYRSLVHAEQDGQLAYLDKNVYAHH